jgi:PAS domain S-box-containing protein
VNGDSHFGAIVASSDDAILSKDRAGTITSWNPGAQRMYGYSAAEAIGSHISMLVPPERAGEELRIIDTVFGGGQVEHYETERVTKDGRLITVSLSISPVRDEKGDVAFASVISRDITAVVRSRRLAEGLQEITLALSKEITPERMIEKLLDTSIDVFGAAGGAVGLLEPETREIVLASSRGYSDEGMAPFQRFPLEADNPMAEVIRAGAPTYNEVGQDLTVRYSGLADAKVKYSALAMVPLSVSRPIGALSLSFNGAHRFDDEQKTFLMTAAQQAAHALENARLYESQRRMTDRAGFLAQASDLLAGSLDPEVTMQGLAELAVTRIADWCAVDVVQADGSLRNVAVSHRDPGRTEDARELIRRYPPDPQANIGAPQVTRSGEAELYPEISDELLAEGAVDDGHLQALRNLGLSSAMIVPLVARRRTLGAITYASSDPAQRYGPEDLGLAEDLARRAALAIDNAMLFNREHQAALSLQRSLLPDSLPGIEGIEFAAHYSPGAEGVEVGGDLYEATVMEDGTVSLTIGDVAGRGIPAAAVMGRVRTALRAYVLDGYAPADVMQRVDRLLRESGDHDMVTVFHLRLDPASGIAEYVRAGHPPALLRLPDGTVQELSGAGTPPIGILSGVDYQAHAVTIPEGSLLLLYTDGLIERPGQDLGKSLEQLKAAVARAPEGAQDLLDALREEFGADEVPDDVAMVAMSRSANGAGGGGE